MFALRRRYGLLTVTMHDQTLNVAGNTVAINKLAESLTNFFDEDSEIQDAIFNWTTTKGMMYLMRLVVH